MKKHTLSQRLRYRFDNYMSKGTKTLIALLFLGVIAVILLDALLANLISGQEVQGGLGRMVWDSFMRALDAGTMSADNLTGSPGYIIFMSLSTLSGILLVSLLIGIITTNFSTRVDALQHGNPPVMEKNHTLILGFDEHVFTVISELTEANKTQKHCRIVILMDMERVKMEDILRARIPDTGNTKIICRSGRIDNPAALCVAGIENCKAVIILPQKDDAVTIKSILGCRMHMSRAKNLIAPVTASIYQESNLDAARIAGGECLKVIYVKKTIARIIAQAVQQPGLSAIFNEIFSFSGSEMYCEEVAECFNMEYGKAVLHIRNAWPMGLFHQGTPYINPPPAMVVEKGDRMILLEKDDGTYRFEKAPGKADESAYQPVIRGAERVVRKILILGCNPLLHDILKELSKYVATTSDIRIAAPKVTDCPVPCRKVTVTAIPCNIMDRTELTKLLDDMPDAIIILSDNSIDPDTADASTLTVLLHLNELLKNCSKRPTIVSEMQDTVNQSLAQFTHVNDLVVGSNLVARILTHISENHNMAEVFETLLSEEGSEIHIKPINRYVKTGVPVNMHTIAASVLRYGELFIGYKTVMPCADPKINLNPDDTKKIIFSEQDSLVVLAENDE